MGIFLQVYRKSNVLQPLLPVCLTVNSLCTLLKTYPLTVSFKVHSISKLSNTVKALILTVKIFTPYSLTSSAAHKRQAFTLLAWIHHWYNRAINLSINLSSKHSVGVFLAFLSDQHIDCISQEKNKDFKPSLFFVHCYTLSIRKEKSTIKIFNLLHL